MANIICLDPGHGGSDPGANGNGLLEKNLNLTIALSAREELRKYDCQVVLTRQTDVYVSLADRIRLSDSNKADLFVSMHNNAATAAARGFETFVNSGFLWPATQRYRDHIHDAVYNYLRALGVPDRGKKQGNYYVTREPNAPAVLIEYLFVTNQVDAALLKQGTVLQELGRLTARGIAAALALKQLPALPAGTPLVGPPQATAAQAQSWAGRHEHHPRFIDIAPVYWKYGERTGIRPEVLYAQAARETAFGRYQRPDGSPGAVRPEMNNWAGIKTREAQGDATQDHETFITPDDGVRAHFNHIAAYTGLEPAGEPHGRYHLVKGMPWAGTINTVEELGGRWAPAPDYGELLVQNYLNPLLATEALGPVESEVIQQLRSRNEQLEALLTEVLDTAAQMRGLANGLHKNIEAVL